MNVAFCRCTGSRAFGFVKFKQDSGSLSLLPLEDRIYKINDGLHKINPVREKINELKHTKDQLAQNYIETRKYNENIEANCVNYRALVKQFRDKFETPRAFTINNFTNNKITNTRKIGKLIALIGSGFYSKTDDINFPHLIGIKKNPPTINSMKEFISNIHYEQDLIKDYALHGMDKEKLKSFGWINQTITNPDKVFLSDAITSAYLKCDIAFVKIINGNVDFSAHVVCMKKTNYTFKGKPIFTINSQFPKCNGNNLQFNQNKAVFVRK